MSGTSSLHYLSPTLLGTGNGFINGEYDSTSGESIATDLAVWTYIEPPSPREGHGSLSASQKATGYNPEDFWSNINDSEPYGGPHGTLYGQFANGPGYIDSRGDLTQIGDSVDRSWTSWFTNPSGKDEPWGIYKLDLGGY